MPHRQSIKRTAEALFVPAPAASTTSSTITYPTASQDDDSEQPSSEEDPEINPFSSCSQFDDDEEIQMRKVIKKQKTDPFEGWFSPDSASSSSTTTSKPQPQDTRSASNSPVVNVRVGVGVLLKKSSGKVIAGIRKGSHGSGKLALPGGHLEMYESWAECGSREVMEEVGVDLSGIDLDYLYVTNDPMKSEGKHYITIFLKASIPNGSLLQNLEPHKCEGWSEYSLDELKASGRLFGPLAELIRKDNQKVLDWINS